MRLRSVAIVVFATIGFSSFANAGVLYSNGFETDTTGWFTPNRVASGTGGVTSSEGAFHATTSGTDFTRWGGYNYGAGDAVPTVFQEYYTSIDLYLDVNAGYANDTRFDFSSAISNSGGTHLRDFIFNAGFYNDNDGSPGSGTDRFIVSASLNSQPGSADAKNPGRDPIAITNTGWYTFEHHFYQDGGFLFVDMTIFDVSDVEVNSWTLGGTDAIAGVGGSRYGWFDYNQIENLAFDATEMRVADAEVDVPAPGGISLLILGVALTGFAAYRRKTA